MQLTPEQVAKFQAIYKAKFGREISNEQAYEQGVKLVRLMEIVYRPMTRAEYKKAQERRQQFLDK
jgi:hypothetical protein